MSIKVKCACGAKFTARDELGGATVQCISCGAPLQVPAALVPAASTPAAQMPPAAASSAGANPAGQPAAGQGASPVGPESNLKRRAMVAGVLAALAAAAFALMGLYVTNHRLAAATGESATQINEAKERIAGLLKDASQVS